MFGPGFVRGDERQIDLRLHHLRELDLGFFRRLFQTLQGHAVFPEVNPLVLLEFRNQPLDDLLVNVVAAQMRVAVGGLHFHDTFADFQRGDVKGSAAQVVHGDGLVLLLIQAVGQRRRRRLVDDAHHLEARNFARLLGGLPLAVVEIRRNGNHRLGHLFPEKILRGGLQLLENHRGDFRRAVRLAENLHARVVVRPAHHFVGHALGFFAYFVVMSAHEALDGIDCVFRVGHRLALGDLARQALAAFGDTHDRRRCPRTLLVGDNNRFATLHDGHNRVGCAQVNPNNLAHVLTPPGTIAARPAQLPGALMERNSSSVEAQYTR